MPTRKFGCGVIATNKNTSIIQASYNYAHGVTEYSVEHTQSNRIHCGTYTE